MKPLTPDEMHAVATVLCLLQDRPSQADQWDAAKRHGPHLHDRLRAWLKEQL